MRTSDCNRERGDSKSLIVIYFYVMLGGSLGALLRFILSNQIKWDSLHLKSPSILIANILGCFILGTIFKHPALSENLKACISIGFLGSLTTFSTLIHECFEAKTFMIASTTLLTHLILGMAFYLFGLSLGKTLFNG